MPLTYVSGDPLLTRAQMLAFGHNAKGRVELGDFETLLHNRCPAAFSTYSKQCRNGRIKAGTYWLWRDFRPMLIFLTVRDSPVGATRLRYVQSVAIALARDYHLEGIESLAIAPLGEPGEWPEIKLILETWFEKSALPVSVYDDYRPGVQAEEVFGD